MNFRSTVNDGLVSFELSAGGHVSMQSLKLHSGGIVVGAGGLKVFALHNLRDVFKHVIST